MDEIISFDEWSRKCQLQITLCDPEFREKAKYIWDSAMEAQAQKIKELESFRTAYMEWSDKTDWVRSDKRFDSIKPLGKHLADVLREYILRMESGDNSSTAQESESCEEIAINNYRTAMEGIGHIRRTLEETFGGLHGTHVEPDILAECKAICDAICSAYRYSSSTLMVGTRVSAEHRLVIEMLLNVCGAAFELADDSCQQDVDGENCHVVPDDSFKKLSDALDEIENKLPSEYADLPGIILAWAAIPRAALKSILVGNK